VIFRRCRRWRDLWRGDALEEKHSAVCAHSRATFSIAYGGRGVINHAYRIAAVFNGDRSNGAVGWGDWYFKITR
jgi:hypothetical protein